MSSFLFVIISGSFLSAALSFDIINMFWLLLLGVTGSSILGVAHNKQSLYLADTFTCLDGSLDLPSTFINDNFCDCPDGSDEPGTSACYNSQFYCAEEGYSPYYIPASQVNDNICGMSHLGLL